jgi:hypothetical protein
MFEPVTITRSTSAEGAAAPGAAGTAGAGNCANMFDAKINSMAATPTPATEAVRKNPTLFITFFVISFSITLAIYQSAWFEC